VKNFDKPLNTYVHDIYRYFDSDKYKISEYFLQPGIIETDDGIIFKNKQSNNYFQLVNILTDSSDLDSNTKQLMSFILYSGNNTTIYYRNYIKITEIIAAVGGVMQVFRLLFGL